MSGQDSGEEPSKTERAARAAQTATTAARTIKLASNATAEGLAINLGWKALRYVLALVIPLILAVIAFGMAVLLFFVVAMTAASSTASTSAQMEGSLGVCFEGGGEPLHVDIEALPGEVGTWSGEQLTNAALILNAGADLGIPPRGQVIGVMTAMGESTLRVVDFGDSAGPDSRGLFQQRANGTWGSYADRMDPTTSATNFFRAMVKVEGWQQLEPTIAAHRTQINADPYHYQPYWDDAVMVTNALTTGQVPEEPDQLAGGTAVACASTTGTTVSADGWAIPSDAPVTSQYGTRVHPVTGESKLHAGTDFGARCGTPVGAAADGVVLKVDYSSSGGNRLTIDHGGGVTTRYLHLGSPSPLAPGAPVTAGQEVGQVGTTGRSTGCHLHFEVQVNGEPTDPQAFYAERGNTL